MELIPSAMSLYDYIENDNKLTNAEVQGLFRKIVTTIEGCFKAGVSHKDIKPENILLFRDKSSRRLDIKVIDFGCGERISSYKGTDTGGTRIYWPPEYIKGGKFLHIPATVWSLGTLLYYMACRDEAFYTDASICRANPSFPKNVPKLCRDLIMRCFVKDPWDRLSFHGILSHPWLAGHPSCLSNGKKRKTDFIAELELETANVARRNPKRKKHQTKEENVSLMTKKKGRKRDRTQEDDTPQRKKRR
ncbi:serine/threonine-protein kinase pim-2-like [Oratosquilla oratoria]|uniref:serine/threonine-protein kinase pim-2-like n=1 Tax=Oratosquilla oratoria TaxID=337810 RepID=UPI003F77107C